MFESIASYYLERKGYSVLPPLPSNSKRVQMFVGAVLGAAVGALFTVDQLTQLMHDLQQLYVSKHAPPVPSTNAEPPNEPLDRFKQIMSNPVNQAMQELYRDTISSLDEQTLSCCRLSVDVTDASGTDNIILAPLCRYPTFEVVVRDLVNSLTVDRKVDKIAWTVTFDEDGAVRRALAAGEVEW